MKEQTYAPLEDRLLIRPIKPSEEQKSEGGIITDPMKKETQEGIVVAVGPGRYATETGAFMPTVLGAGDKVVISFGYGMDFDLPTEKGLKLMREGDVLLLVEKNAEN